MLWKRYSKYPSMVSSKLALGRKPIELRRALKYSFICSSHRCLAPLVVSRPMLHIFVVIYQECIENPESVSNECHCRSMDRSSPAGPCSRYLAKPIEWAALHSDLRWTLPTLLRCSRCSGEPRLRVRQEVHHRVDHQTRRPAKYQNKKGQRLLTYPIEPICNNPESLFV